MIRSGKIKLDINPEKQNRHSLNHSLYLKNKNFALKNNERLPSYTTLSINELNRLVQNGFNHKKVINFERIIGKAFIDGKYIETTFGKVHYSKTDSHIIPFISKEK